MAMIGMIVGDDHAIDRRNLRLEQLLADVGTTVDEEPAAPTLEKDGRAQAPIARLSRIALPPVIPDPRNTE
jgi:hypothetical protein